MSFRSGYDQDYAEIGTSKHTTKRVGVSENTVRKMNPPLDLWSSRGCAEGVEELSVARTDYWALNVLG